MTKGEPPTWRNLSHYLSQSFAAIRMSAFSFFLLIATRALLLVRLQQLIIKDLQIVLHPLDYLLPVKRLHSSFSVLLPGGVTHLQVEVLYSSTQYYFVVGLATTLCLYPILLPTTIAISRLEPSLSIPTPTKRRYAKWLLF
jgi:hypothetical protein